MFGKKTIYLMYGDRTRKRMTVIFPVNHHDTTIGPHKPSRLRNERIPSRRSAQQVHKQGYVNTIVFERYTPVSLRITPHRPHIQRPAQPPRASQHFHRCRENIHRIHPPLLSHRFARTKCKMPRAPCPEVSHMHARLDIQRGKNTLCIK